MDPTVRAAREDSTGGWLHTSAGHQQACCFPRNSSQKRREPGTGCSVSHGEKSKDSIRSIGSQTAIAVTISPEHDHSATAGAQSSSSYPSFGFLGFLIFTYSLGFSNGDRQFDSSCLSAVVCVRCCACMLLLLVLLFFPSVPPSPTLACEVFDLELAMAKGAEFYSAWFLAASLLLVSASAVDSKNNPADELVSVLNTNRTAHKSSALSDNPGLGCLALEYIKAYQGQCGEVDSKKPPDSQFANSFAPNCGVLAPSLAQITGRLLGCQGKYMPPSQAFSDMLIHDSKSLEILYDKNHTQVGAAVSGTDGGGPYFWCILFSNGKANNTFLFEGGVAKTVRPGCFSGNDDDCSSAHGFPRGLFWGLAPAFFLMAMSYAFVF